jgi:hypothetical protein
LGMFCGILLYNLHTDVTWIEFLRSSKSRAGTGAQPLVSRKKSKG